MTEGSLVICDREEEYATAFANYLTKIKTFPFQVKVCSDRMQVEELLKKQKIHFLLIHEKYYEKHLEEELDALGVGKRILLTERNIGHREDGLKRLYKYQSGEALATAILGECSGYDMDFLQSLGGTEDVSEKKVIGIFSPVHRCGRTRYALKLGKELGISGKVLYMGMECYGGCNGYFPEGTPSVADALYYARQENQNLGMLLPGIVESMENLDYLPPAKVSEDMRNIRSKDWIELIGKILKESNYRTLILDIDDGISGVYDILRVCTELHVLSVKDKVAAGKIDQFEQELHLLGYDDLKRKIIKKEQPS